MMIKIYLNVDKQDIIICRPFPQFSENNIIDIVISCYRDTLLYIHSHQRRRPSYCVWLG